MKNKRQTFKPPFFFDDECFIFDSDNNPVLQVRGYGKLLSDSGYNDDIARKKQDQFAEWVVNKLNQED